MNRRGARSNLEALQIGDFLFEEGGRLAHGDQTIVLPPKEAAFLRILAQANGATVSKQEFLDAIWPAEDVSDASLTRCVHQLRRAFGDRGRLGAIETLHGRGYRLSLPVRRLPSADDVESAPRLAIVPFEVGRARADRALADGLAGDVAMRLARIHGDAIAVIDVQSARRIGESDRDLLATARRIGVDHLAHGALRRERRAIRVSLELIAVDGARATRCHDFESSEAKLGALAGEIAESLAKELGRTRVHTPKRGEADAPIHSKSYLALLQGHFESQLRTERGIRKGIQCFGQAIDWDRRNADAYAALADAHLMLGMRGYAAPREIEPIARDALAHALALDPRLPAALVALAYLRFAIDWEPEAALDVLARAGRAAESHARVQWMGALIHTAAGRFDEAIEGFDRSIALDPFAPNTLASRAWALSFAGRHEEALAATRALARTDPELALGHGLRATVSAVLGRKDEAVQAASLADAHARGDQLALGNSAWALGVVGRTEQANGIRAALERKAARHYVSAIEVAGAHAGLGECEGALTWLERAVQDRCMFLPFVAVDPRFAALREDARFRAIADLACGRGERTGRRGIAPTGKTALAPSRWTGPTRS